MIVIAIIGILSAVLYPSITGYFERARDIVKKGNVHNLALSMNSYYIDNWSYMVENSWLLSKWIWFFEMKNDCAYNKSIISTLKEGGYYKWNIKETRRICFEDRGTITINDNSPCFHLVDYPDFYILHASQDWQQFIISTYIKYAKQSEKDNLSRMEDDLFDLPFTDPISWRIEMNDNHACKSHWRNYWVGNK